jgi:hypothetical protein
MIHMKKTHLSVFVLGLGSLLVVGCGSDSNSGSDLVDPSDPNALSQVIVIPGAQRVQGQPPASSGTPDAPTISGGADLDTGSGEQAVIEVGYESPSGYVDCYVQVIGADDYFLISAPSTETTGVIQIPVNIPENVSSGVFDFYTCIAGENGGVSNPIRTSVDVTYTGNPGGGGGNVICATDDPSVGAIIPCPNGQSLDFCIDQSNGSCYYAIGGNRIECGNCLSNSNVIVDCAQRAVEMCI